MGPTESSITADVFLSTAVWAFLATFFKLQGAELSQPERLSTHTVLFNLSFAQACFPVSIGYGCDVRWKGCNLFASKTITLLLIISTDVHPRPQMFFFCLIISHGRSSITEQLIFRCTFSADRLRRNRFPNYFPTQALKDAKENSLFNFLVKLPRAAWASLSSHLPSSFVIH